MRARLALALVIGLCTVSACTGVGNDLAAVQAMNNPPNSCGPGGSPKVEDCRGHR